MSYQVPAVGDRVTFTEDYNHEEVKKGDQGVVTYIGEGMSGSRAAQFGESKLIAVKLDKGGTTEVFEKRLSITRKYSQTFNVGDIVRFTENYSSNAREGDEGVVVHVTDEPCSRADQMVSVRLRKNGITSVCYNTRLELVTVTAEQKAARGAVLSALDLVLRFAKGDDDLIRQIKEKVAAV